MKPEQALENLRERFRLYSIPDPTRDGLRYASIELKEYEAIAKHIQSQDERIAELEEALKFYGAEAKAISRNLGKNETGLVASISILSLDAGNRARSIIK